MTFLTWFLSDFNCSHSEINFVLQENRLLEIRWQGPDSRVVNSSVEAKEPESGGRGSNPLPSSDLFAHKEKFTPPPRHWGAIFPTLVGFCFNIVIKYKKVSVHPQCVSFNFYRQMTYFDYLNYLFRDLLSHFVRWVVAFTVASACGTKEFLNEIYLVL